MSCYRTRICYVEMSGVKQTITNLRRSHIHANKHSQYTRCCYNNFPKIYIQNCLGLPRIVLLLCFLFVLSLFANLAQSTLKDAPEPQRTNKMEPERAQTPKNMVSKRNLVAPDPCFFKILACFTVVARRKPKDYQVSESQADRAACNPCF